MEEQILYREDIICQWNMLSIRNIFIILLISQKTNSNKNFELVLFFCINFSKSSIIILGDDEFEIKKGYNFYNIINDGIWDV